MSVITRLSTLNKIHGTSFQLGQRVRIQRHRKSPHIGIIAQVTEGYIQLIRDNEYRLYPALYNPEEVTPCP